MARTSERRRGLKRILVVDDEMQITRVLGTALRAAGYEVATATNGLEAWTAMEARMPDMVITDLAMPEMNGLELTQAVRRVSRTPILVLSVRDAEATKVKALDAGADDYLTKPFGVSELLARVRAHLRRNEADEAEQEHLAVGVFVLDAPTHTVALHGEALSLTPKEYDLMALLLHNADRVMRHRQLLRALWGPQGEDQPQHLRVLVGQLRKKLDRGDGVGYIASEPWVGYRLHAEGFATGGEE